MRYAKKKKQQLEFIRNQADQKFQKVKGTWIDCGRWAAPHLVRYLQAMEPGTRINQHIVDTTHILALRSYVAGFLEGNTSATRPWFRTGSSDPDVSEKTANKYWLDTLTRRSLGVLASSNFYHVAAGVYYGYGVIGTSALWIEELTGARRGLHFHLLAPGQYKLINDAYGEAVIMVREFRLNVKSVVDTYAEKDEKGNFRRDNISKQIWKMYDDANYTHKVDICAITMQNPDFDPSMPVAALNKQWITYTYEVGGFGTSVAETGNISLLEAGGITDDTFLRVEAHKRKPFITPRSETSDNFEYGETSPTLAALGTIKSLNKKAIGKDQALDIMLQPPMQGPANLRKSYIAQSTRTYVPLDAQSLAAGKGLSTLYEINPAISTLNADVMDLRQLVDKLYFADFLLFLSKNPKTRTATETNAILQEQQLVIGPNLQSLNWTFNVPLIEYVLDYVIFEDPFIDPMPPDMAGQFLRPEMISVFAQAQRAADLPAVDRYMAAMSNIAQLNPAIWDKVNMDRFADLYEDRLYLPAGLNRDQSEVDAKRQQAQAQAQRQQMLQETLPAVAGAAKDMGVQLSQKGNGGFQ